MYTHIHLCVCIKTYTQDVYIGLILWDQEMVYNARTSLPRGIKNRVATSTKKAIKSLSGLANEGPSLMKPVSKD